MLYRREYYDNGRHEANKFIGESALTILNITVNPRGLYIVQKERNNQALELKVPSLQSLAAWRGIASQSDLSLQIGSCYELRVMREDEDKSPRNFDNRNKQKEGSKRDRSGKEGALSLQRGSSKSRRIFYAADQNGR